MSKKPKKSGGCCSVIFTIVLIAVGVVFSFLAPPSWGRSDGKVSYVERQKNGPSKVHYSYKDGKGRTRHSSARVDHDQAKYLRRGNDISIDYNKNSSGHSRVSQTQITQTWGIFNWLEAMLHWKHVILYTLVPFGLSILAFFGLTKKKKR